MTHHKIETGFVMFESHPQFTSYYCTKATPILNEDKGSAFTGFELEIIHFYNYFVKCITEALSKFEKKKIIIIDESFLSTGLWSTLVGHYPVSIDCSCLLATLFCCTVPSFGVMVSPRSTIGVGSCESNGHLHCRLLLHTTPYRSH